MTSNPALSLHQDEYQESPISSHHSRSCDEQIPRVSGLGLALGDLNDQEAGDLVEEPEQDYEETPETKSLLPPLPSSDSALSTPRTDNGNGSFETFETNLSHSQTPTLPKSAISSSSSQSNLFKLSTVSPEVTTSPRRNRANTVSSIQDVSDDEMLNYAPAINIQERFEVCLDIPMINESTTPKTTEEKIKLYENVQKKEIFEFDKTLKNLKSSGWMTEKEIKKLETSKLENFNKWETKIKNLKSLLRKSPNGGGGGAPVLGRSAVSDSSIPTRAPDDYFCSQRYRNRTPSVKSEKDVTSPSLKILERKFSSLGF